MKNTKAHLSRQIAEADRQGSDWVYILKSEARMCLELAEAEDVILEMYAQPDGAMPKA